MEQTKAFTVGDIKPYIRKKSPTNGLDFYYYLHIRGGAGINPSREGKHRYGGEYDYIVYYASPTQMHGLDSFCERNWCEEHDIIYGEGDTIEEAYIDYLNKTK